MSGIQTAWMELIIVGGLGVILILVGLGIGIAAKKKNAACTAITRGLVVKYRFNGEGTIAPVVEFTADGKTYRTRKKYNGIVSVRVTGLPNNMKEKAWEDEKGYLHVKTGTAAGMGRLAEELWPIGSQMTVCYDPADPKRNYVDRPITNRFLQIVFVCVGIACAASGILVFFLIQI